MEWINEVFAASVTQTQSPSFARDDATADRKLDCSGMSRSKLTENWPTLEASSPSETKSRVYNEIVLNMKGYGMQDDFLKLHSATYNAFTTTGYEIIPFLEPLS